MSVTGEDLWQAYRREMIAETERFIEWGLRHPEDIDGIPAKPIGRGGFPRAVADWFYNTIFIARETSRISFWREKLRRLRR